MFLIDRSTIGYPKARAKLTVVELPYEFDRFVWLSGKQ